MMAIGTSRARGALHEWVSFALQVAIAVAFEVGDDLARGLISQHGSLEGVINARRVVTFEATHGLWVEPAWQTFFLKTRQILDIDIDWTVTARAMNGIYVLGHVLVTLGVAIWVFRYRRRYFRLLRNTIICVNAFALVVYETFPVAPPRMTTGLIFNHHHFRFIDTLFGMASSGQSVGSTVRYNEFSAMPSVHDAWALVAGVTLLILARPVLFRAFGATYPILMLLAIVVTGNHFLLDAAAAVAVVGVAFVASLAFEWWQGTFRPPWHDLHPFQRGAAATPI